MGRYLSPQQEEDTIDILVRDAADIWLIAQPLYDAKLAPEERRKVPLLVCTRCNEEAYVGEGGRYRSMQPHGGWHKPHCRARLAWIILRDAGLQGRKVSISGYTHRVVTEEDVRAFMETHA